MARLSIRYFVCRPRHNGTERYYWQPDMLLRKSGWQMRRLSDTKSEALQQAEAINERVDLWRAKIIDSPENNTPGTVDAVIAEYKKSRYFLEKSEKTRKDYSYYLKIISDWAGSEPANLINQKMVHDLYETLRTKKPRKAAYLIQVLRLLFSFAESRNTIPKGSNPAAKPRLEYRAEKGKLWPREAVEHFVKTADDMGLFEIGTAVMLNEWMGQRAGDLMSLSMNAYKNGVIFIKQSKTGAEVELPVGMIPAVKSRIDAQIVRNKTKKLLGTALFQQSCGKPYLQRGLMKEFERVRERAAIEMPEISELIFKDLRHTAVTRMAESGSTVPQIASVTGHSFESCQAIVDRYNIRTGAMARSAFENRINTDKKNEIRR